MEQNELIIICRMKIKILKHNLFNHIMVSGNKKTFKKIFNNKQFKNSKPNFTKHFANRSTGGRLECFFIFPLMAIISSFSSDNASVVSCAGSESYLGEATQATVAVAPVIVAPLYPGSLVITNFLTIGIAGAVGIAGYVGYRLTCRCWTGASKFNLLEPQPQTVPHDLVDVQFTELLNEGPLSNLAAEIGEAVMTDLHGVPANELDGMSYLNSVASAVTQGENGNISFHLKIVFVEMMPQMLNLVVLRVLEHPYVTNFFPILNVSNYQLAFLETLVSNNTNTNVLTVFCVLLPRIVAIINNWYEWLQLGSPNGVSRTSQLEFLYLIMENEQLAELLYYCRTQGGLSLEMLPNFFQEIFIEPVNPYEIPVPED